MFLSRETYIKRKFIYMQFCIKVVVLNRSYSTNMQSENDDFPQEPIMIFIFYFSFLIDIIDNIITYSPL